MEYEDKQQDYEPDDVVIFHDIEFRIEYVTDGGARIKRTDVAKSSFWVPFYMLNRFEFKKQNSSK